jgi:cell wall-associated NlpC family hydrolase
MPCSRIIARVHAAAVAGRRQMSTGGSERAQRADQGFALSAVLDSTQPAHPLTSPPPSREARRTPRGRHAAGPRQARRSLRPRGGPLRIIPAALTAAILALSLSALAPAASASAATVPKRLIALEWAEQQAGKWYCWGGAGPSCFDCSGLVMAAYRHAGIALPRTTYQMLADPHLRRIPASQRRRGDLAFYGSGHVELVTARGTFGALHTGTRIGWHTPSVWWHPTMYFRFV